MPLTKQREEGILLNEAQIFRKISENDLTKGEKTKLHIIRSCVTVLHERGLTKFTFDNIATQCGLKKSHIAYHFPNKIHLFDLTVRYVFLQGQNIVVKAMNEHTDPLKMLQAFIYASHDWILKNPQYGSTITAMLAIASQKDMNDTTNFGLGMIHFGYQRIDGLLRNIFESEPPEGITSLVQDWLNGRVVFCASTTPRPEKRDLYKYQSWQVAKQIAGIPDKHH